MLGPVVRILVKVIAVALGAVGLAIMAAVTEVGLLGLMVAAADNLTPFEVVAFVAFFLMLPLPFVAGWKMVVGTRALAVAARRVGVGFQWIDIQPALMPTRFVAGGRVDRSVIEVADLTSVIVRHYEPELELVDFVMVSERPAEIHLEQAGASHRLHRGDGPALRMARWGRRVLLTWHPDPRRRHRD